VLWAQLTYILPPGKTEDDFTEDELASMPDTLKIKSINEADLPSDVNRMQITMKGTYCRYTFMKTDVQFDRGIGMCVPDYIWL